MVQVEPIRDPVERFRITVFYKIYTLIEEVQSQVSNFQYLVVQFKCIIPDHINDIEEIELLSSMYGRRC